MQKQKQKQSISVQAYVCVEHIQNLKEGVYAGVLLQLSLEFSNIVLSRCCVAFARLDQVDSLPS